MKEDIITNYTWNILKKQLQKNKVNNKILYKIVENVKEQLTSIIYHWNDTDFINSILILGSEEGNFYEPSNHEKIANMVVMAVRNSLLEGISSNEYKRYGNDEFFPDSKIKDITSAAIEYFKDYNLDEYSKTINIENDFYFNVSKKYPVAMKALEELSKCTEKNISHEYKKIYYEKPYELKELENVNSESKRKFLNIFCF